MSIIDQLNEKFHTNLPPLFDVPGYAGSPEKWGKRRGELLELYRSQVYGRLPEVSSQSTTYRVTGEEEMSFNALKKVLEITVRYGGRSFVFPAELYLPMDVPGKAPCFLHVCRKKWLQKDIQEWEDAGGMYPLEDIIARGYATAWFDTEDVAPDDQENFKGYQKGIYELFGFENPPADTAGAIGLWAFCTSRLMDVLQKEQRVDASRVAVVGHSRLGKTALWCGAQDERFAMTVSNESGAGGAALARIKGGERVVDMIRAIPYWFCENYRQYSEREEALPIDQHLLLSLVAPRLLYVSSASLDDWADPQAEFYAAKAAGEVYSEVYGISGLAAEAFPPVDTPSIEGNVGYHVRTGEHHLTRYDWKCFMDFADRHLKSGGKRKTGSK